MTEQEEEYTLEEYQYAANMIAQARIYDVLLAILSSVSGDDDIAKRLLEMHRTGTYMYPPPRLLEDMQDNE